MAEPVRGGRVSVLVSPLRSADCGNLLLRSLDPSDFALIWPYLEPVPLNRGHVIVAQGEPITFVCFPESGITSVADVLPDGTRTAIALIGREGMTNSQLLLGCRQAPHEASVQVGGGRSLRLPAHLFNCFCAERPAAHALFLRFIHSLSVQTARTLASNLRDPTEKRLSRWLLMCHDRIDGDEIQLIHEHISRMLGVRRATVTDALHILEGRGAVKSNRGRILIRDRAILETIAGCGYGFAEDQYRKLVSPFGKSAALQSEPHSFPERLAD